MAFIGNIHTPDVMLYGSSKLVEQKAAEALRAAGRGGGFVLSTGDQCGRETPDENLFALVRAAAVLDTVNAKGDERTGVEAVRKALGEPLKQIVANAGEVPPAVLRKVEQGEGSFGFNAETMEYEDLMAAGVIDPAKVTRTALENAASVATLLLTCDCCVTEIPQDEPAGPPGAPGMGGGMGGMGGGMGGMGGGMGGMGMGGMGGMM